MSVALLPRLLFRRTVESVRIDAERLRLTYRNETVELRRGDLREISPTRGLLWDRLRLVAHGQERELRGLSHGTAAFIADTWNTLGLLGATRAAVAAFRHLLDRDLYLNHAAVVAWRAIHGPLVEALPLGTDNLPLSDEAGAIVREYRQYFKQCDRIAKDRNEAFVARKKQEHAGWFQSVGGAFGLTDEQQAAILHDEDNCLVVAGAGTGKTSTVAGKCRYLVHTGAASPERVLLLAFTKKAADEMGQRLSSTAGFRARTFHALGLEIVAEVEGRRPALSPLAGDDQAFGRAIMEDVTTLLDAPESRDAVVEFLARFRYPYQSPFNFATSDEYLRTVRAHDLRTLQGERVKSHEEVMIADWFFLNGIAYEYERAYEHDTASILHRQYKPDFYLPDGGIYLEHFGVDRAGKTAPWIDAAKYRADMEWKRELHRKHATKLIETYSWQRMENRLHEALAEHMRALGVTTRRRSATEVAQVIHDQGFVKPVVKLLGTFLSLYKSNMWSPEDVARAAGATALANDAQRNAAFLKVFHLVHERYEARLRAAGEVDFNDMIALAARHVEAGRYRSQFTHVVVDECQDLSRGRARLLRALLDHVPERRLFCVGDDWQSIYRFTGGDIAQMTNFAKEFGFTKRCDLTRTHRFASELLEASSQFVQQNPAQLRKRLSSARSLNQPGVVVRTTSASERAEGGVTTELRSLFGEIAAEQADASVMVLGRYNHTLPEQGQRDACARRYAPLRIEWLTVHRAKGLEADYAIILDVSSAKLGFPAEISDDPVLDMVLAAAGGYPNAEERRLFYVALTRARKRTYLLVPEASPSKFASELADASYGAWVDASQGGAADLSRCPECGGRLVKREASFGVFWGCANFPLCEGKAKECPRCRTGVLVTGREGFVCSKEGCRKTFARCPACKVGAIVWRKSGTAGFWGCTEWRPEGAGASCTYKHREKRSRRSR